jgi:chaperonin GroEL
MGAELLKEVASKINDIAGDGTITATVLGHAIFTEGLKMISTGRSAIDIKKGMDYATDIVIKHLRQTSIPLSSRGYH